MSADVWNLDGSNGELLVCTGVEGRAARMGHRLTIAVRDWRATVSWSGEQPARVELTVEVSSLEVVRAEGGLTPLSGPEKIVARSNALKALRADRYPEIRFVATDIDPIAGGYRLAGSLRICDKPRDHGVDLRVDDLGDAWRMSAETEVSQKDFGIKPYSMLMGSMKVVDTVTVSCDAHRAKDT